MSKVTDCPERDRWAPGQRPEPRAPARDQENAFLFLSSPFSPFFSFFKSKSVLLKMKFPVKPVHCLLFKDVVSLRIKDEREEIKKALREDAWRLGRLPGDPLADPMELRSTRAYQGPAIYGPCLGFDKYLCAAMKERSAGRISSQNSRRLF